MVSNDRLLSDIQQLSQRMLELGRSGDWETVERLELKRRGMLSDCFNENSRFREPEMAAERVTSIIEYDSELLQLGEHDRQQARDALARLQQGRTAARNYQEFES